MKCELVDPDGLVKQLRILKSINVDGVMVDCWWGIVEAHAPQDYNWNGYKRLFQMVRELKLKLQVSFMSKIYFHASTTIMVSIFVALIIISLFFRNILVNITLDFQ